MPHVPHYRNLLRSRLVCVGLFACWLSAPLPAWAQADAQAKPPADAGADAGTVASKQPAKVTRPFDGKTLKGWKVLEKIDFVDHGKVEVEDGEMVLGIGSPMTGIKWDGAPLPKVNYEVTLEARRKEGSDFFCGMTFPVKKSHCSLILGGWGGSLTGLSSLDGFDASENDTTNVVEFEENKWYKIRLRVTNAKIEAWVDDEQIVDCEIVNRQVSLRWEMEQMPPFGFATYMTKGGLRKIVIRQLDE
jgi:hypothetical protein